MIHDNFTSRVYMAVAEIPYGKVATYGVIARLAGSPRAARQVGGILRRLPEGTKLPWYRVINRHGEISLTGEDYQRQWLRLRAEGIELDNEGKIDFNRYGWQP